MRVLVTGARGFLGAQIVAALSAAGHEVVCAVRAGRGDADSAVRGHAVIACDMARDRHEEDWLPRLERIDAVVNCAGILRERGADTFQAVHVAAPLALFRACVGAGVRRVIQISALGDPADGEFVASKHRCDEALATLDLDAVVLRPSVVYSAAGSYGGTSLLRALAALPYAMFLPGDGTQRLQPVAGQDLGALVVAVLAHPPMRARFDVVGPQVLTLAGYLRSWRRWLGCAPAREIRVPDRLTRIGAGLGEALGRGPLGLTMLRMLARGNVSDADAVARLRSEFGIEMRALAQVLDAAPAQVQDRWHARLYFLLPLARVLLALLWIASGLLGWLLPAAQVAAVTLPGPLAPETALLLARAGGTLDLGLGVLALLRWRPRWVLLGMLAMLAGYTIAIGVLWPQHWLDPLGGLLKNLPLIALVLILLTVEERR